MNDTLIYPLEKKEYPNWAIFYDNDGYSINGEKIMGRQAAGWSYLKALIKSNPLRLGVYLKNSKQKKLFQEDVTPVLSSNQNLPVDFIPYNQPFRSQPFGGVFVPGPGISHFADERGVYGAQSYSLVGITHTTASHRVMTGIKGLLTSRVMPWDAVICTSSVVLDTVNVILENEKEFLSERLGVKNFVLPKFPIIPLGIDCSEFNYSENFKNESRKSFKFNSNDIVISFVGRLSFHAKAHHFPMYIALEKLSKDLGKKIHLIQTGWFGNEFIEDVFKKEVKTLCPNINCIFLDGTDQENKHKTLASSDIFISLSDNIQETFGITPIEGMASGLPVIVSDWNGYKETVRNNIDGYKIKTISLSKNEGLDLAYNHMIGSLTYDLYIGLTAQRVAIDVNSLVSKLSDLILDKDKRIKMGIEARKRAKTIFDWSNVLKQYVALGDELDDIRISTQTNIINSLPSDRLDPFSLFSSYPSIKLKEDLSVFKTQGIVNFTLEDVIKLKSVNFGEDTIPPLENLEGIYNLFNDTNSLKLEKVLKKVNMNKENFNKAVIFLLKYGYLSIFESKNE